MLRPVGNLPPAVYWRRRLMLLGGVVVLFVLLVLTVKAVNGSDSAPAAAAATSSSSTRTVAPPPATGRHATSAARHVPKTHARSSAPVSSTSASSSAPPKPCAAAALRVQAVVEHSRYAVGAQPVVMLQATDTGTAPCVQDFGNGNVELRIYNGESRVWGSNDCGRDSGSIERTLLPNQPVRVRITWSGLSSQPGLCDHRQRVGAGTYTVYATLSGKQGAATQFALT